MNIETRTTEMGDNFNKMMDEAAKLVADGDNEQVLVVVAKGDGKFHVLTDIETPLTITLTMMQAAAKMLWNAKKERVQQTQGEPEIVES